MSALIRALLLYLQANPDRVVTLIDLLFDTIRDMRSIEDDSDSSVEDQERPTT